MARLPGKSPRGRWLRTACAAALLGIGLVTPSGISGQPAPVSLIADAVTYDEETGLLTAQGNVEVFYEGRVLKAESFTYDENTEQVAATGPITLTDPNGTVFIADSAQLNPELTAGLIQGARLLIAGELQVAAAEAERSEGRFTTLHNTVATSCTICAENPRPTWSIRARRVTRDEAEKRIYFEGATFLAFGVPFAYLPAASVPDPTETRASGFLIPEYRQSGIYGSGVRVPYFWEIDPTSDATVTPFVTTKGAFLLEGEYRKRFANGGFDISTVYAFSDAQGGSNRGAYYATGEFDLRRGFTAEFELERASDESFLQQFDYSDEDRLTSEARIYRYSEDEAIELRTTGFQSLRDGEDSRTVPFILPRLSYQLTRPMPRIGGRYNVEANALGVTREIGQEMFRMGGGADWRRDWPGLMGIQATTFAGADIDAYQVRDSDNFDDEFLARTYPTIGADLRWPWLKVSGSASHVIEPVAQVIYSEAFGDTAVPNEDSRLPELDETNLLSLNRYPGRDGIETGLRANLGVRYTRYDPAGWSMGLTFGQVVRAEADDNFRPETGLAGRQSDYVGAVALEFASGLTATNRTLLRNDLTIRRNELALARGGDWGSIEAAYTFLAEDASDPDLGIQEETDELGLEASYRVHPNWEISGLWRYDASTGKSLRVEGGVTYGNECAEFDLKVSRRFTSSDNVPPSTSLSFAVRIAGLGEESTREWPSRTCALAGI